MKYEIYPPLGYKFGDDKNEFDEAGVRELATGLADIPELKTAPTSELLDFLTQNGFEVSEI